MNTDHDVENLHLADANNEKMRSQVESINRALKRLKKCSSADLDVRVDELDWDDEDTEKVALPPDGKANELKKALNKAESSCKAYKKD